MDAIALRSVTKQFGAHTAVNDLSLHVPEGSLYGFIGPNGSGKTTTLRMIMNILLPDRGEIEVLGQRDTVTARDRVSYLPEERGLYKRMTVRRLLRYYGELNGATRAQVDHGTEHWLRKMELAPWVDKKVEALSKGMSQKVQFIAAIIAAPKLVIFDEPFSGLDPVNAEVLKDAVLDLRKQGTTVVFSTHDMTMAEKLCDRIFMIFRGNKVLDGTLDEIQAAHGFQRVHLRTSGGVRILDGDPLVASVNDLGNEQDVQLSGDPQAFLANLISRTQVQHFEIRRPSLHEIFVRIVRAQGAEA